jgi:hypothetical protein
MRMDDQERGAQTAVEVDAAMARVLRAEEDARAAVAAAQVQAAHIAELSRTEARALTEQRRSRLARLHSRIEHGLASELDAIAAEARALPGHAEPDALARDALERAVQALAAELTQRATAETAA